MTSGSVLQSQVIQRAWQDPDFKAQLLKNPKAAIQEVLGVILPDHIKVTTVEENSNELFLVLPPKPSDVMKSDNVKPQVMWGE
ncbi:NHLP leader peptide family natural product precursor [Paenibacillus sp. 79R4]|uniref:NHLP leader peptide family RiPP precursor n=1 Tax=Paenibacillus sp. 79R4 TaxID=2212847 RepID=UPI0015BC3424|nr:NHLP leader peptide family RiPP precursor [Paenibacillus sp. 79R4]NWL89910.1 NHLP leader peptide family natural product precursor [Paenibacillus sp. 79R4]